VAWEKGLFWLWLAGAVGWVLAITIYIYDETKSFTLSPSPQEWLAFLLLWVLPPMITFIVYLLVLWIGRRIS